jgi:hypothetical protein
MKSNIFKNSEEMGKAAGKKAAQIIRETLK